MEKAARSSFKIVRSSKEPEEIYKIRAMPSEAKIKLLCDSCQANDIEEVTNIIMAGVDVNLLDDQGQLPLNIACQQNSMALVKLLVESGADVNKHGTVKIGTSIESTQTQYPLHIACKEGCNDIVQFLLDHGADVKVTDEGGITALWLASSTGRTEIVQNLLKRGVAIDAKTYGWGDGTYKNSYQESTALLAACDSGHREVVEELLQHEADTMARNSRAETPLHCACKAQNLDIVKLLAEKTNVNTFDVCGMTPLHIACEKNNVAITKFLIEHGADVNKSQEGWTPLMSACMMGHADVAKVLLAYGADADIPTSSGETPLSIGYAQGHVNLVDVLLHCRFQRKSLNRYTI